MNSLDIIAAIPATEKAIAGFYVLMTHVYALYTCGESSSISESEAYNMAESVLYVLGLTEETVQETLSLLASENVVATWTQKRTELEIRISKVMKLWEEVVAIMPLIHKIALRDTLTSIGELSRKYDTFFGAHEIPCSIDYPLSQPISEELKGLDYVETWLEQLLFEARYLARFDTDEMVAYLKKWCPDYQGLLINLYEPIHEAQEQGKISCRTTKGMEYFVN